MEEKLGPYVEVHVQWPSDMKAEGSRGARFDAYDRHLGTLACVLASPWSILLLEMQYQLMRRNPGGKPPSECQ